jgi:hypothetical protein
MARLLRFAKAAPPAARRRDAADARREIAVAGAATAGRRGLYSLNPL